MTVQEFVNIDKDLQTVQDISDVNIIILIYLFIKHVSQQTIYQLVHQTLCQTIYQLVLSDSPSNNIQCSLVKLPPVQEFVNIDKDLQTVQDISDVNIIILIYLFIKHVLFILMYLYKCEKTEFTPESRIEVHKQMQEQKARDNKE
jgi:hypothetical protein